MNSLNNIKLKVCGMRDTQNILEVSQLLPDYLGFIFYRHSKRFVGNDFVVPKGIPAGVKRVGVFVNETTPVILQLIDRHHLDLVQLHGDETARQCEEIRKQGAGVIKAFGIDLNFNFDRTLSYADSIDYLLFDTKVPDYGGSGSTFDWGVLEKFNQKLPFFLSGGISHRNIGGLQKLKGMNLHAIDVNSGVEKEVGLKDVELIKDLKLGRF